MKNLRAIQKRTNDVEIENDLRGIDDESLLKSNEPKIGLVVEGEKTFLDAVLHSMVSHAHLSVQRMSTNRVVITHGKAVEYKEQIVDLFICGLSLTPKTTTSSPLIFGLIVTDVFQNKMLAARDNSVPQVEITESKVNDFMQMDTFFKISRAATPTLRQAGFNIEAVLGDSKLDRKTIIELMPKKVQTQSAKKVI